MRKSRANVAEMIEPLESRTCLSGLIAYLDFFTGALVHGHFPHTVAAMTLARPRAGRATPRGGPVWAVDYDREPLHLDRADRRVSVVVQERPEKIP